MHGLNVDTADITAALLQAPDIAPALTGGGVDPEVVSQVELPKVIQTRYPNLSNEETEQVRQGVMTQMSLIATGGLVSEKKCSKTPNSSTGRATRSSRPTDNPAKPGTPRIPKSPSDRARS